MIKKLTKFGNSMALIIDKPILQLLHMEEGIELELKIVDDGLLITPVKKYEIISKDKKIQAAFEKTTKKYHEALKKLAK
jgi:antitoxin MazE